MRPDYARWIRLPTRWGDMDAFGHVNNAVYFTYCESARIELFQALDLEGLARGAGARVGPGVVSATCNFRRQVRHPAQLDVGVRAGRVGQRSFTLEYGLFLADEAEPVADGSSVVVWIDYAARGGAGEALPLPELLRERLAALSSAA